jgi:hypothetical protein
MSIWTWAYLIAGVATIYPYYRFALAPKSINWRQLDPIFFPLVVILAWPFCALTIALAIWVTRRFRDERS